MVSVKQYLVLLLAMASFVYTLYVVTQLIPFLSAPRKTSKVYTWVYNLLDDRARLETAYGPMVFNTLYLILFIMQHSCMKSAIVKNLMHKLRLASAERAIYSLTSSLCLHYLIKNWLPASSIVLWQVDVEDNNWLWYGFVLLHSMAWIVICGGSLIMDLPELIGIKQAYYDMKSYSHPLAYKSYQLRNLYAHVRHPSFLGFTLIFWANNLMTLDRLLLAIMLTTYMYIAWSTDKYDLTYQRSQLERKKRELKSMS